MSERLARCVLHVELVRPVLLVLLGAPTTNSDRQIRQGCAHCDFLRESLGVLAAGVDCSTAAAELPPRERVRVNRGVLLLADSSAGFMDSSSSATFSVATILPLERDRFALGAASSPSVVIRGPLKLESGGNLSHWKERQRQLCACCLCSCWVSRLQAPFGRRRRRPFSSPPS